MSKLTTTLKSDPALFVLAAAGSLLFFAMMPFTALYGACTGGQCANWIDAFGPVELAARSFYVTASVLIPFALGVAALRVFLRWSARRIAAADAAHGEHAGTGELHNQLVALTLTAPVAVAVVLLTWVATLT